MTQPILTRKLSDSFLQKQSIKSLEARLSKLYDQNTAMWKWAFDNDKPTTKAYIKATVRNKIVCEDINRILKLKYRKIQIKTLKDLASKYRKENKK